MNRRILHIDMDAFFASVEQVRDPSLQGKPLIIGGSRDDLRGVVSTASYEARAFGVRSAMPLATAKRLCPNGVFMRGNRSAYAEASHTVHKILETVSPRVQMASIDEAYVDVSGSQTLFGGDCAIASHIKSEIRRQTGLPCTIAISPNKLVSKVASDFAKPDGYIRIAAGDEAAFLAPLAVEKLPGLGPRLCERLNALGIATLGELAAYDPSLLERRFGAHAVTMQRRARGDSRCEVIPESDAKSIGRETTFAEDLTDWEAIERALFRLMERGLSALRESGMEARSVTLKVRYTGFETHTHAVTLASATSVDSVVFAAIRKLLPKAKAAGRPVRLIGVTLSQLSRGQHQLQWVGSEVLEKWERALKSIDQLRGRHGFDALRSAKSMEALNGRRPRDSDQTGDPSE